MSKLEENAELTFDGTPVDDEARDMIRDAKTREMSVDLMFEDMEFGDSIYILPRKREELRVGKVIGLQEPYLIVEFEDSEVEKVDFADFSEATHPWKRWYRGLQFQHLQPGSVISFPLIARDIQGKRVTRIYGTVNKFVPGKYGSISYILEEPLEEMKHTATDAEPLEWFMHGWELEG